MSGELAVTLIAGGVGGAKMAEGFASLPDVALTVIGNIADDEEFHGLWVSPDIDTLTYTLAGLINREQGWGVADEGRRALDVLESLGTPTWMFLGDKDFGLHIYRTERRRHGDRPSAIARDVAARFGVTANIVLPTDDVVQTRVKTDSGWLSFQEYFVRERCAPDVRELDYRGIETAGATPEAIAALETADLIVIAPSNPLVSIKPILQIAGITEALKRAPAPVIAVSPLIAGQVIKGPAARMMTTLGHRPDSAGVAEFYEGLATALLIASEDAELESAIRPYGIRPVCTDIFMPDLAGKRRLASEIVSLYHGMRDAA